MISRKLGVCCLETEVKETVSEAHNETIVVCELPGEADARARASVQVDPAQMLDDFTDYSRAVVRKPWGYEYLIFSGPKVAVWMLHIKKDAQTSMHCHPGKTTSLVVLDGEAQCSTLERGFRRKPGQAMRLGAGVFHRTKALGDDGTFVMEIESPVNKRDLIRVHDDYGREAKAYESTDWLSRDLENFNYFSTIDDSAYYNARKSFGDMAVVFRALRPHEKASFVGSIAVLLSGSLLVGTDQIDVPGQMVELVSHDGIRVTAGAAGAEIIVVTNAEAGVRIADAIVTRLRECGVEQVFFVPDAVNAHLVDALVRDTRIKSFAFDSEHSACLAAEGYAKASGKAAVVFVASGASSLSALNGVANAWVDSCPLVVISGQSLTSQFSELAETGLRQAANKALNIVQIVGHMTKSAELVWAPAQATQAVEQALLLAVRGRPGPCWVDIPIDVLGAAGERQSSEIGRVSMAEDGSVGRATLEENVRRVAEMFAGAKRPVVLAGYGVRSAGAVQDFRSLVRALGVPVLLTRRGIDLLPATDAFNFGVPGAYGQRAANFILQNSDLLLCIGARLSRPLTGRHPENFATQARKIVVDVDVNELSKASTAPELAICADAGEFCRALVATEICCESVAAGGWLTSVREWAARFPAGDECPEVATPLVGPCQFVTHLSQMMAEDEIIVVESGFVLDCFLHGYRAKAGQQVISAPGLECAGFALPAAVGASIAGGGRRVVVLLDTLGVHSFLPELRLIAARGIPVKLFVFDAPANMTVRRVQLAYFGGRVVPSPTFEHWTEDFIPQLMSAAGLQFFSSAVRALASSGPSVCRLQIPKDYEIRPRTAFEVTSSGRWLARQIEDMHPLLDRNELACIMRTGNAEAVL